MSSLILLWLIVGLRDTISHIRSERLLKWWRTPKPIPPPPPPPQERPPLPPEDPMPHPNWLLHIIIGAAGGVIGGWVFTVAFGHSSNVGITTSPQPDPWMQVVVAAATTVGAFLGASVLTDLYGLVKSRRKVTRG